MLQALLLWWLQEASLLTDARSSALTILPDRKRNPTPLSKRENVRFPTEGGKL
jgi:hypothetical protein